MQETPEEPRWDAAACERADMLKTFNPESLGDAEERRRLQDRLMHVSRLATVGEMAAGIAHELNQPLAAVANYAQACERLLALPDPDLEEIREALREVAAQAVRAGDIIHKLRALARGQESPREVTDVEALLSELRDLIESDARHHQTDCRIELGRGLPPFEVDRAQIQQVILSLVRNALEALADTPIGSRQLLIRTALAASGDIEITICDSGPGVSPRIAERLFEPFCTTKATGTGLGLASSRSIARAHGGRLDHRPNVPAGACFVLSIPRAHSS
jgi:two-component system sensor kinase FixL